MASVRTTNKALIDANERIQMYKHLLAMKTITVEDLAANFDISIKIAILKRYPAIQEEFDWLQEQLDKATRDRDIALGRIKPTPPAEQPEIKEKIKMNTEVKVVEAKPAISPRFFAPAPSLSVSAPSPFNTKIKKSKFKEEIKQDLKNYLAKTKKHKKILGKINFEHGFLVFSKSRAINREANYRLAKQLLKRLENGESVNVVFSNINYQRDILINKHGLDIKPDYTKRDIHSDTLNAIIDKATGKGEPNHYHTFVRL